MCVCVRVCLHVQIYLHMTMYVYVCMYKYIYMEKDSHVVAQPVYIVTFYTIFIEAGLSCKSLDRAESNQVQSRPNKPTMTCRASQPMECAETIHGGSIFLRTTT